MRRVRQWLNGVRRAVRRRLGETVHAVVTDPPDATKARVLFVVGDEATPWCAILACPCGCGETIRLSLVERDRPRWTLTIDNADRPTLSPSIHRVVGCRSHFFLRAGRIVWADRQASSRRHHVRSRDSADQI